MCSDRRLWNCGEKVPILFMKIICRIRDFGPSATAVTLAVTILRFWGHGESQESTKRSEDKATNVTCRYFSL